MKLFKSSEYKRAKQELILINAWEPKMQKLKDSDFKKQTEIFKQRIENREKLEDIRIEAFALSREAAVRVLKKRPFDVQILGALVLDYGSVAEMKTGEGKTITSIMPVYLNALSGKGVMVSTVNEYLTTRDAEEMGEVHNFLGLTVGINLREKDQNQKREAYAQDVTYSVHSEIGFDYLRDNMVKKMEDKVQRGFNYVLIDEVDSILIDEARTPLIITGGNKSNSKQYMAVDKFAKSLKPEHYDIDWESKGIQLSEKGTDQANKFFNVKNIFAIQSSELVHRVQNALRANYLMSLDADYIVRDGKVLLVDAFTGRIMEGRSYSDGLQQAIQAKELLEIEDETQTMATITYQNLFRMFKKLSGMTGTAETEENEFIDIYNIRVNVIPTNEPMIRIDHSDVVYVDKIHKYQAIVDDIAQKHKIGQPILVGTSEVSESESLSRLLTKAKVKHVVLNAKQNEQEAEIIANAGQVSSVTIATNMAGRGTDIKPSPESVKLGGLYVIGTNKAESRRVDNQLRGRSGRQGDPGESRFYLSLDDQLISRFSNQEKLKKNFSSFKDKPIKGVGIAKALNRAQKKIEGFNFDSRKNILQYDDVIRQQRDLIYSQRDIVIGQENLQNVIERIMLSVAKDIVDFDTFKRVDKTIDIAKLTETLNKVWFSLVVFKLSSKDLEGLVVADLATALGKHLLDAYAIIRGKVTENFDVDALHKMEREILLKTFDQNWQMHIDRMTKLRSSSSLASYAQKNPYQVYVEKGAEFFKDLLKRISHNATKLLIQNRYAHDQSSKVDMAIKASIVASQTRAVQSEISKKLAEKISSSRQNKDERKKKEVTDE